tara:strand:+ start:246 stop:545 length:300 start_codon:yes stop_codon:yes gene_type:complete
MLKKIGTIIVDSGTVWIGDFGHLAQEECDWIDLVNEHLIPMDKDKKTYTNTGTGIVSRSFGDGEFNVFAVTNKTGKTQQLIIDFENDSDFPPPHFAFFE